MVRTWRLPHRSETDFAVEGPRQCSRFEDNLRMVGDWTDLAAEEITDAYRRFLYLKALTGETLTPPSWVDAAWHLHMSFPTDYAALQAKLERTIVHRQRLTGNERRKAWDRGRALWKAEFDFDPSAQIWPPLVASWRIYTGFSVLVLNVLIVFLFIKFDYAHPAIVLPIWLGGGLLAAALFAQWSPETISRCG